MHNHDPKPQVELDQTAAALPVYELPVVVTYTDEQLLEALGPAQSRPRYGGYG